jgi:threonyl-tRNA synthetase
MVKLDLEKISFKVRPEATWFAAISMAQMENPLAVKVGEKIFSLNEVIGNAADFGEVDVLTFDDMQGKKIFWHSSAHILAQSVKRLYPGVKLGIGPAVENGFYYDFDFGDEGFSHSDTAKIESEIAKIISENFGFKKSVVSKSEAESLMKNEPYKLELISEKSSEGYDLTIYSQGEFSDFCIGPHLPSTGTVGTIAITNVAGAYWKGNAKNKMLIRIYGVSFPKRIQLEEYLEKIEESKKRDHNKIGRELGYFTTVDYIGQGLPILMPKGARVIQILQRFVEDEEEKRGYLLTKTPFLAKKDLYEISGHWSHYRESMFILDEASTPEILAMRPMTCPFQFQVFLNEKRSYRDLPMRLNETSTLFRNEQSGEMHGLIRVRQFTISEGHIACTPEQLSDEFNACLDLIKFCLETLGIENDVYYRFSKWDKNDRKKYIGEENEWEKVQNEMRTILDASELKYEEVDGEAAFYGPKLDVQFKNVHEKEDTLITVQIDFQLAKRFEMKYTDFDGTEKEPYVIHRTSIGCYERVLALLIEKYAGAMPLWLAPEQVRILPINENLVEAAKNLEQRIKNAGIVRINTDERNEKIGYKIRSATEEKVPYMIILGKSELENSMVSVRHRLRGDLGRMSESCFVETLLKEIEIKK